MISSDPREMFAFKVKSARFSECRRYRYTLSRQWSKGGKGFYLFLGVNPSTADEEVDDPTVAGEGRRAFDLGYDGLLVGNLHAYRATDPKVMKKFPEPVGPENDAALLELAEKASLIVCAWGNDGEHMGRAGQVVKLLRNFDLYCLKINEKTGQPGHPLYLRKNLAPRLWIKKRRNA